MQLWEGIRLAMVQIWAQKLKSFFSLLGVIIGVLFLIVVVSVVEGMDRYIREDFSSQIFGINTVTLRRWPSVNINTSSDEWRDRMRNPRMTMRDADYLRERLETPARIAVQSDAGGEVHGDNGRSVENVQLVGASFEVFRIRDWAVERGRLFSPQEDQQGAAVAVLGFETAEVLFEGLDPIGRSVRIRGNPFRVIGVLEEEGSLFGQSLDNRVVAPANSPIKSLVSPRGYVDEIIAQVEDPALVRTLQMEIEGLMRVRRRLRPAENSNFAAETAEDSLSFWDNISRILFTALPALVGISLVVGGVVIMNIMLVSVMERTREIGVRKAMGARRRDILTQVIIESATLSTLGAALGVAAGLALAGFVASVSPLPAAVSPFWVTLGVLLGTGVGIAAGVYPAARASRLHPVDALRHE
ncbi:MAG: ABC transporter permease [Longimicrobiales bacterium]|nr:ABC transporter permease [Longimicrobiales bacterium]